MSITGNYGIADFGAMLADDVRADAYVRAMRAHLQPGDVVLDLGTGPGFFAVLACHLGAGHVYAIDPSDTIRHGPTLAEENGCADRITFMQAFSTEVTLPQQADLIISDLRGVLPLFGRHIASLADAHARHLAPGGVLLPRQDTLWAAPVTFEEKHADVFSGWSEDLYGVRTESIRQVLTGSFWGLKTEITDDHVMAPPACWGTLDYASRTDPDVEAEVEWTVERAGSCQGFVLWFDAEIAAGIVFSNAPGRENPIYGRGFFPWKHPVELEVGDRIEATLGAHLIDDRYIWRWSTRVTTESGSAKAEFRQSSLQGSSLTPASLQKRALDFRPQRAEDGEIAYFCLSRMDADHTVEEIAQALAEQFPHRFPSQQAAWNRVAGFSDRYAE